MAFNCCLLTTRFAQYLLFHSPAEPEIIKLPQTITKARRALPGALLNYSSTPGTTGGFVLPTRRHTKQPPPNSAEVAFYLVFFSGSDTQRLSACRASFGQPADHRNPFSPWDSPFLLYFDRRRTALFLPAFTPFPRKSLRHNSEWSPQALSQGVQNFFLNIFRTFRIITIGISSGRLSSESEKIWIFSDKFPAKTSSEQMFQ